MSEWHCEQTRSPGCSSSPHVLHCRRSRFSGAEDTLSLCKGYIYEPVGADGAVSAFVWKGPRISNGGAEVIFQAIRAPTKRITSPRIPETPLCNSRKGEARPAKSIDAMIAPTAGLAT